MQLFVMTYPTLAVSAIYCIWQAYLRTVALRDRVLRERVAYMLWILAERRSCCEAAKALG
jgi:hypothetical protein